MLARSHPGIRINGRGRPRSWPFVRTNWSLWHTAQPVNVVSLLHKVAKGLQPLHVLLGQHRVGALLPAVAAWPNPFNPGTKLTVTVPTAGRVSLGVYDLQGRLVRSLLAGEWEQGTHPITWDGRNDGGLSVPSGVYFARASTPDGTATAKLLLVK